MLTSSFILRILYGYPLTCLLMNDKISGKKPFLLFPIFVPVLAPFMVPFLYNNETFLSLNCSWLLYPSQDHRGVVETIPASHGWRQVHPWVTPQLIAVCIRGFSPLLKGTSHTTRKPFMFWSDWPTFDELLNFLFWMNNLNVLDSMRIILTRLKFQIFPILSLKHVRGPGEVMAAHNLCCCQFVLLLTFLT